jgi:pimeloyl-ACP methyl ester carboxylesterase
MHRSIKAGITTTLLALTFASCGNDDQPETPPVAQMVTDSVLSADNVMIYYDVHGTGDHALVFIHCWCCDRTYWDAQVEEFSKDYKVVTLDLAGHGQSGRNRNDWTMEAFGADVAAVADKLGLNDMILIGHSMGGTVMIEAARLLDLRVTALIGVDNLQKLDQKFSEEDVAKYLANYESDFSGVTYKFIKTLFPPTADTVLADGIAREVASAPKDIALGSFASIFRYDYVKALSDVRIPIRCINSDEYPTDVEGNNRVAESFAVTIMPAHGHYIYIIDPTGFNAQLHKAIEEFWPKEPKP